MENIKEQFQVIQFTCKNIKMCIELDYIEKVISLPMLKKMPDSAYYLIGLLNLAGLSVPVIDLIIYVGMNREAMYSVNMPILICAANNKKMGIIVDEIVGIEQVDKNQIQMQKNNNANHSIFTGVININSQLTFLIDMKKLFNLDVLGETVDLNEEKETILTE